MPAPFRMHRSGPRRTTSPPHQLAHSAGSMSMMSRKSAGGSPLVSTRMHSSWSPPQQAGVHAPRRRRCVRDLALPSLGLGKAAVQQRHRAAEQRDVPADEWLAQPVSEPSEHLDLAVVCREVAETRRAPRRGSDVRAAERQVACLAREGDDLLGVGSTLLDVVRSPESVVDGGECLGHELRVAGLLRERECLFGEGLRAVAPSGVAPATESRASRRDRMTLSSGGKSAVRRGEGRADRQLGSGTSNPTVPCPCRARLRPEGPLDPRCGPRPRTRRIERPAAVRSPAAKQAFPSSASSSASRHGSWTVTARARRKHVAASSSARTSSTSRGRSPMAARVGRAVGAGLGEVIGNGRVQRRVRGKVRSEHLGRSTVQARAPTRGDALEDDLPDEVVAELEPPSLLDQQSAAQRRFEPRRLLRPPVHRRRGDTLERELASEHCRGLQHRDRWLGQEGEPALDHCRHRVGNRCGRDVDSAGERHETSESRTNNGFPPDRARIVATTVGLTASPRSAASISCTASSLRPGIGTVVPSRASVVKLRASDLGRAVRRDHGARAVGEHGQRGSREGARTRCRPSAGRRGP